MKTLFHLLIAASVLSGCVESSVLNSSYNLGKVRHIAVVPFDVPSEDARGAEDLFAKHLLEQGFQVVERSRLDAVMKEASLSYDGILSPDTTKKLGQILGVDALLIGEVTSFVPQRKNVVVVENKTMTQEPVFQPVRQQQPDGSYTVVNQIVGQNVRREKTQTPQTFVIDAQVGVVAKLVDVETGELIWVGSDDEEAVTPLLAMDSAASSLVKKLRKGWEASLKKKPATPR